MFQLWFSTLTASIQVTEKVVFLPVQWAPNDTWKMSMTFQKLIPKTNKQTAMNYWVVLNSINNLSIGLFLQPATAFPCLAVREKERKMEHERGRVHKDRNRSMVSFVELVLRSNVGPTECKWWWLCIERLLYRETMKTHKEVLNFPKASLLKSHNSGSGFSFIRLQMMLIHSVLLRTVKPTLQIPKWLLYRTLITLSGGPMSAHYHMHCTCGGTTVAWFLFACPDQSNVETQH